VSDIFTDVQFNFGAAFAAISAVHSAAADVNTLLHSTSSDVHLLEPNWDGGAFRQFQTLSKHAQVQGEAVHDQLIALATEIGNRMHAAKVAQAAKVAARQAYFEEQRRLAAAQAAAHAAAMAEQQARAADAAKAAAISSANSVAP
jgi:hypothetical protein